MRVGSGDKRLQRHYVLGGPWSLDAVGCLRIAQVLLVSGKITAMASGRLCDMTFNIVYVYYLQ